MNISSAISTPVKCLGLTCLIVLVGCSSPASLRQGKPAAEYASAKTAKEVAICIADKWENSGWVGNAVPVQMRPTATGFTVAINNNAWSSTAIMADVDERPSGSATRYFTGAALGASHFEGVVWKCQ